jgi:GT2 family glycosyltransferase
MNRSTPPAQYPSVSVIIPVFNAMQFLPVTAPAILQATQSWKFAEVIYVDNGSNDGSSEFLKNGGYGKVVAAPGITIGAVRNRGASEAAGQLLCFLDSDCYVDESYLSAAVHALSASGAQATGSRVALPPTPGWIERTWDSLHPPGPPRFVEYINSGNFVVFSETFWDVGGFDSSLPTGEDAEIGKRMRSAGLQLYEDPAVNAVHLGNPKSIKQFYRRNVWHGLGVSGTSTLTNLDKPTQLACAYLLLTCVALFVALTHHGLWVTLGWIAASQLLPTAVAVWFRLQRGAREVQFLPAFLLYWLYVVARAQALIIAMVGRANHYRK